MPALAQVAARVVGGLWRHFQLGQQVAVRDHQAAGDPQPGPLCRLEQRLLGGGEVRAEDERGRRAVGGEPADEALARSGGRASASAIRASSGRVRGASQSSSCSPIAPITAICGKWTWVSTSPGSRMQSRRSMTSASGCSRRTAARTGRWRGSCRRVEGDRAVVEGLERAVAGERVARVWAARARRIVAVGTRAA